MPKHPSAKLAAALALAALPLLGACEWGGSSLSEDGSAVAPPQRDSGGAQQAFDRAAESLAAADKASAIAELERAIELDPGLVKAHMALADIARVDGDFAKAEKSYGQAARLEPGNFDAQYYHGMMLHALNRLSEAAGAYLRALALKPDDFAAAVKLASVYYQLGESGQALPMAERAVRLNPRDGEARYTLGVVYAEVGRHADAIVEFQQAAELMELSPRLLLAMGKSLGALQRWDEMRNALAECVRTQPSAEAFERLGAAEFKLRRYPEALAAFNRAVEIDPDYFPALNGIGVCELNTWLQSENRNDTGAKSRGLGALRRSLQINRDQPRILEILARYP